MNFDCVDSCSLAGCVQQSAVSLPPYGLSTILLLYLVGLVCVVPHMTLFCKLSKLKYYIQKPSGGTG